MRIRCRREALLWRDRRVWLIAALAVALVVYFALRPGPEAQVEAAFADIERAFVDGDGGRLFDRIDRGYDIVEHWPQLEGASLPWAAGAAESEGSLRAEIEALVKRYLFALHRGGESYAFTYRVEAVETGPDGLIEARVTIGLRPPGRRGPAIDPPVPGHRFTLVSTGWLWPRALIRAHEPFPGVSF